jgi:hypothetical protein
MKVRRLCLKGLLRKSLMISVVAVTGFICSSCSPYIWMAIAAGMLEGASGSTYNTPYPSYGGTYYSAPSSTSSYSSTPSTCPRCNGTGKCKSCGGAGRKYDYGTLSIISDSKYEQRCGVCNGTGKCGVCDGKGHI